MYYMCIYVGESVGQPAPFRVDELVLGDVLRYILKCGVSLCTIRRPPATKRKTNHVEGVRSGAELALGIMPSNRN